MALTSAEGLAIKQALDAAGVKAVVSHQHRYGEHYQKVKEIIASGAIGQLRTVYGTRHRMGRSHAQPSRGIHVLVQRLRAR